MTDDQELHLQVIKTRFNILLDEKYKKGQKEHGGNLWEMSDKKLLDNTIDEAIDQVVYLLTLKEKLYGSSILG